MINLHERMLPTSVGVEPATSWSAVGQRIQLSHRGRLHKPIQTINISTHMNHNVCGVFGWCEKSCILCHRDVQLILAYSWARPAILVAGKGREVMFLFLLFLHFHSCSSFFPVTLSHLFCYLFCLFSPFLWETTQNDPKGLTCR